MTTKLFSCLMAASSVFTAQLGFSNESEARFAYVGTYTTEAPGGWSEAASKIHQLGLVCIQ